MNRTRRRAFLLVEMLAGMAILCGVVMVLLVVQSRAAEIVAADAERVAAASWLSELVDGVRAGAVAVDRAGETKVKREAGGERGLRDAEAVLRCDAWPGDAALTKVTVTLRWRSMSRRSCTLSAQTLVRASRLRIDPSATRMKGDAP